MSTAASRDAEWLVNEMVRAGQDIKALAQPQLGTSSIEQGAIEEYDADDTLTSLTGTQFDGTHTSVSLAGPQPPMPSQPSMTPGPGQVQVRWNGLFEEDALSPMDFSHVSVHMSQEEAFDPDQDTQVAQIRGESGDSVTVLRETGEWWVSLVAVSQSGKWSDPTEPVLVEIPDQVTVSDLQDAKIELDDAITAVQVTASGKNRIYNSTVDPTPADAAVDGDRWQVWTTLDPGGRLTATWRHNGTDWIKEALDEVYLPLVNIGSGTYGELIGSRLTAASVKAEALEALLVLVNEIVAGNPGLTHVRLNQQGFFVRASPDGGVTPPQDAGRLGVNGSGDFLSVLKPDGTPAATISETGDIAGQTVSAGTSFTYQGTELEDYLAPFPQGIDTSGFVSGTGGTVGNIGATWMRVLSVTFVAKPGRNYKAVFQGLHAFSSVAGDRVNVKMIYGNGFVPSTGTAPTDSCILALPIANNAFTTPPLQAMGTFNPDSVEKDVTVMICIKRETGTGAVGYNAFGGDADHQKPLRLWVEDMGPDVPETGTAYLEAGTSPPPTPPPPKVKKTVEYAHTGVRSYTGSNATYAYNTSKGYQGLSPSGYGNLKSIWTFPSVTSLLSGATVNEIWAYFYFEHWWYGSGGTARIALHGHSSVPGTYSSAGLAVSSGSWPRGAGRWVKLPSGLYSGFASGAYRGFALEGDGTYNTYGIANAARLRITYTK